MIRCDTCANSEHCNEIASSDSMCFLYICNLNFSVGQTVYFTRWEQNEHDVALRCLSGQIIKTTSDYIEVKVGVHYLSFLLSDYGKTFSLNKKELYSVLF